MKVLIADFNLYSQIGGGQTFYQRIIETLPQIEFYYLITTENVTNKRPQNANIIKYNQTYIKSDLHKFSGDLPLNIIERPFLFASNIAASIANNYFDIIDCPDYEQYAMFLRPALHYYNVKFGKIVLSLHGKISSSLKLDWYVNQEDVKMLDFVENLQYKTVDIRYGISKDYIEECQQIININAYYFNPLHFLEIKQENSLKLTYNSEEKPILNYIGRKEKRKGIDIFINLINYLPLKLYNHGNIIGPNSDLENGKTAEDYIQSMLNLRQSNISLLPKINKEEMNHLFQQKSITFLPSRYDTLNLIALESLFSGCPTVIGNKAGVCRFLEENFPNIPYIKLDVNNIYSCLDELINLLENYQDYQQKLVNSLSHKPNNIDDIKLIDIYSKPSQIDTNTNDKINIWYEQLIGYCQTKQYKGKANLIKLAKNILQPTYNFSKNQLSKVKNNLFISSNLYQKQFIKSVFYRQELNFALNLPENNLNELNYKLEKLSNLAQIINPELKNCQEKLKSGYLIDRVTLWNAIANLERKKGDNLVAVTYHLRIIKLLEKDVFNELDNVINILNQEGFEQEAIVAQAMYSNSEEKDKRCSQLLEKAYKNNQYYLPQEYELIKDFRKHDKYKVSVIVSLYKAENKLSRFLEVLSHQTLIKKEELEIILIDSGSPEQEYKVFQEVNKKLNLEIVYLRSHQRETIQNAWNRGILLSKSPYITFLGVDEMIVSEGLEILAEQLDLDNNLDWVIGHSLVTNVDKNGNWIDDIMLYDRTNFNKYLVYLDTCYLTYVGGLYRRNIHTRFGYYDGSFKGAGDTEFKNRILPYINCKMIDQVLGIFWNYPDLRQTQSPLAEIEDLRAWYLHRTFAGIKYAFKNGNFQDAQKLLNYSLCYRKSFQKTVSTDINYAYFLAKFLDEEKRDNLSQIYLEEIKKLRKSYQSLEKLTSSFYLSETKTLFQTYQIAKNIEKKHKNQIKDHNFMPEYNIFNDNRFEQHSNIW